MTTRTLTLAAVLFALAAGTASSATAAAGLASPSPAQVLPRTFGSCAALVSYASRQYARTHGVPEPAVTPLAGSAVASPGATVLPALGAAAAPSSSGASAGGSTSFSTTNVQEPGVDEPDIVKTDGSTIFTVSGNTLYAVAANGGSPSLAGSLNLGAEGYGAQLLLFGNRLLVISSQTPPFAYPAGGVVGRPAVGPAIAPALAPQIALSPYYWYGGQTTLTEVDVQDPSAMAVTQTLSFEGRFVDARQNGASVRVVISSAPHVIIDPALEGRASGWVPSEQFHDLRSGRRLSRAVAPCTAIRRPVEFSGLGMLTIVTVDFNRGLAAAQSESLMADAQVVYGSQDNLYVATQNWVDPQLGIDELPSQTTVIDKFSLADPDSTTFVASGEVPGYLLNQFSLSEYNGDLRVATTSRPIWWGSGPPQTLSQSYVTVLATSGDLLQPVGQLSGLGAGEQIYSVRFVDDSGYVVTYRQVDPLYTIDLSDPAAPRVSGQLELSGYSAYLQPLGNGQLLGIGSAVDPTTNEPSGTQLDLFDVSDPAAPRLVQQLPLAQGSSSTVAYDHHAFLFWPATGLVVLPVQIYPFGGGTSQPFTGAIGYQVSSTGLSELGRLVQDSVAGSTPVIERSLVIGGQLYTVSADGVMASNLTTLARQAFVAFPVAVPTPFPEPLPGPRPVPLPGPIVPTPQPAG